MQRIGLTGGIAAGKSVAARRLAELGAVVIDSDVLAREAVAPGSAGLDAVVDDFGRGVLAGDGSLDRAALASIVFTDRSARARLDAIVHPIVRRLSAEREASSAVTDHGAVVVLVVHRGGRGHARVRRGARRSAREAHGQLIHA